MSHVSLGNVLIIDDNPNEIRSLIKLLNVENYAVTALEDPKLALDSIINSNIDCVLLDYQFQDVNGIEVLQKITNTHPDLPVIMISGRGSLSIAVEAMKKGAFYYLEKPIEPQIFVHQLKNAVRQQHLRKEREELISELSKNLHMIGKSLPMQHIRDLINKFSPSSEPILILRESGTGKELVAKAIHLCSDRRLKPLV